MNCDVVQGVHAILAADPSLQDSMLELLLPHFALFLQPEGPLLKLGACASLQVMVPKLRNHRASLMVVVRTEAVAS